MKQAQASNTAKVIAASTILLANDRDARTAALVAPGAVELCQLLLSGRLSDRLLARSAAHPFTRALWRMIERLTLPGIMAHYWHRKRWIEIRCRNAIANGVGRVVILGAGFDTLGLRLSKEMPRLDVIEIDHPATQSAKLNALNNAAAMPKNIRFIACDLAVEPFPAMPFGDGKACVIIVEGVLMYLPPAEVGRLFDTLRISVGGRAQVGFSFMSTWPDGESGFRPKSWPIERWLAWRDEPFMWSLPPDAMREFLLAHGFRMRELALTREFTAPWPADNSRLDGENLVWCEAMGD